MNLLIVEFNINLLTGLAQPRRLIPECHDFLNVYCPLALKIGGSRSSFGSDSDLTCGDGLMYKWFSMMQRILPVSVRLFETFQELLVQRHSITIQMTLS